MTYERALDLLDEAHATDSRNPDTRPVRVIRILRVLRPLGWNKLQVRARVVCRDGRVREITVTTTQSGGLL